MNSPLHSATRVETKFDALLVNIETIALKRAPEIVPRRAVAEECVLGDFYDRTVAELPPGCRRAYIMAREWAVPYKTAAKLLGVSPSRVPSRGQGPAASPEPVVGERHCGAIGAPGRGGPRRSCRERQIRDRVRTGQKGPDVTTARMGVVVCVVMSFANGLHPSRAQTITRISGIEHVPRVEPEQLRGGKWQPTGKARTKALLDPQTNLLKNRVDGGNYR